MPTQQINTKKLILLFIIALTPFLFYSQQITTNSSLSVENLIQDNLASGCVEISNVSSSINGSENSLSSFGLFNRAGSGFPFDSGIILASGDINAAGNTPNAAIISTGNDTWATDPDLDAALGINNSLNATSIEFDFISGTDSIEFNYIFASEEYFGTNPCNFSDGFVFLIKETGSALPFTNIAVLAGTSTPVNTTTVHDEITGTGGCPAANETVFAGTDTSTNYNGRTTILTAQSAITANTSYTIKLIIADSRFSDFDSAVFIQANSFDNTVEINANSANTDPPTPTNPTGDTFTTCSTIATLDATVDSTGATYQWLVNGTVFTGFDNMPIVTVNQDATYTVEVSIPLNGGTCTFSDAITVTLNTQVTLDTTLEDIELCDDTSNDGFENFNFAQANTEILAELTLTLPETYIISYHENVADSQSGSNPITNTTAYPNNPISQIFVRAVNSGGCVYLTSFNLIVNPFPIITDPTTFFACIDDGGANLDTLNDGITGGNTDYTVTYHTTQADADLGNAPLTIPYTPVSSPETVFIRVVTSSGCVDTADVIVTVNENPEISTEVQQIDACETDDDGFESFDITSVQAEILSTFTNIADVDISYHENQPDSETGANPISDPTAYINIIAEEQNVYIRIVDKITGCATIHEIELHVQLLHTGTDFRITPNNPVEIRGCDNDSDGSVEFDLSEIAGGILNDVEDTIVQFYEVDPIVNPTEPEIIQTAPYIVNNTTNPAPKTLFVQLTRTGPSCVYNNQITLIINPGIAIDTLDPQNYCDTDDDLTSVTVTAFNFFDSYLQTRVSAPASFTYFASLADAEANEVTTVLPDNYIINNPTTPFSVFFRATNSFGCFGIGELEINFLAAPSITAPTNLFECTTDGTDMAFVDLETTISQINNGPNLAYTFYTSEVSAETGDISVTEFITTPDNYETATAPIFARVENLNGCFDIQEFQVIVNSKPNPVIEDYLVCLPIGSSVGDFFFETEIDPVILTSNLTSAVTISYFEDFNTTTNVLSNPIDKTIVYNNTALSETIFVSIEYVNDPTCSTVISFQINVGELPDYDATITTFPACDDSSNDGNADFDLTEFTTQLSLGSSQSLTITYYENLIDAEDQANPITNINNYNNGAENPKTIFYNIDNGTICKGVASFELQVTPIPSGVTPMPIRVCDTNSNNIDGFMPFDLTTVENDVLANITPRERGDIIINYYPTQADFNALTGLITNPTTYTNTTANSQTVIIQVLNTVSTCYDIVELELIVEVPPILTTINKEICDNATDEFDFTDITTDLIGTQTNVNLEFYESQADANTQTDVLTSPYTYTANSTTLFVRANFSGSTCFNTQSFTLIVNNPPTLVNLLDLTECDDLEFDLIEPFNLGTQTAVALGTLNPANFIVSYHNNALDAQNNLDALTNLNVLSFHETPYFMRIEDRTTGCISYTDFRTLVFRKPMVELEDRALCLDNLPLVVSAETGVASDTYLWSNGATTPSVNINNIGTFTVTITTINGCTNSDVFTLVESESATIEFTETVDFSSPSNSITVGVNGIGNYLFQLDGGAPQTSNVFEDVSYGVHLVTVIDELGCSSITKEVIVFDIPLFLTPNNDDFNDTWHVIGVEQLEGSIIYIFDRFGKLLKTLTHTSPGWNGFYNGNLMPTSDYWYVANIKQGEKEFELKGHFTLKN